jgi:phosphomannomutase
MAAIQFGTDGWRAIIAEDFTFANVDRLAQATADFWKSSAVHGSIDGTPDEPRPTPSAARPQGRTVSKQLDPQPTGRNRHGPGHPTREAGGPLRAIVGYDRRFLSDRFAQRVAEILAGNGLEVVLTGEPAPTPAVSFAVKAQQAVGGVMITASHNPPAFNGYKLKAWFGGSADPAICRGVEQHLDLNPVRSMPLAEATRLGRIVLQDLRPAHFRAVKKQLDFKLIAKSRLRLAHDAMFGVGAGCFEQLLAGTTCQVTALRANHDVLFGGINPEPVERNYAATTAYLQRHPHDLCLVTDGDADRLGAMDGRGHYLSTHQLICLLLNHLILNRGGKGRVVKALTTTSMVDKICAAHGLELTETSVGFKFICAEMLRGGVLIGVEESGGIGLPAHLPERDGILAGMMLLEMLATEARSVNTLLQRLVKEYGPHEYARLDTRFPLEQRPALMEFCQTHPPSRLLRSPVVEIKSFDGVKYVAENGSWLMLRGSGTEPIVRIYAEAQSQADARRLLQLGATLARHCSRPRQPR